MKHTSKLFTVAALITAVITFTGCSKPTDTVPQDNKQDTQKTTEEQVCVHEYEWVETKEAKCETNGEKVYKCIHCDDIKETAVIEALGHDWVLDEDTATCTTDGKKKYHCARCPKTKEEDSPAHHHEDFETSGYCETCRAYKYADGLKVSVRVYFLENNEFILKETLYFSFEDENTKMDLNDLIHLKSAYTNYIVAYCSFDSNLAGVKSRYEPWKEKLNRSRPIDIVIEPKSE